MASAWGSSWGSAWGNSWGSIAVVTTDRGDGAHSYDSDQRKERYRRLRHPVIRPEPVAPKQDEVARKVTRKAIREALTWIPDWLGTVAEAEMLVPAYVPLPRMGPSEQYLALVDAVRIYLEREAERIAIEQDEDDIELLLLAA